MPFNKGDFTQQGVAGHVNANLRLNEKRLVNIDMTSNEEAEGCTITGTVKDLLNDKVYGIGSGVSGNIEITENGENINVAPYATATVNVAGGGESYTYIIDENITMTDGVFTLSSIDLTNIRDDDNVLGVLINGSDKYYISGIFNYVDVDDQEIQVYVEGSSSSSHIYTEDGTTWKGEIEHYTGSYRLIIIKMPDFIINNG